jgi:hypothetical protein
MNKNNKNNDKGRGNEGSGVLARATELSDKMEILSKDIVFTTKRMDRVGSIENVRDRYREIRLCGNRIRMNVRELLKLDREWSELVDRVNSLVGKEVMKRKILDTPDLEALAETMRILDEAMKDMDEDSKGDEWKG